MSRPQPAIDVLEDAILLACHAPSIHNSQPWRWIVERGVVALFIDPDRLVATDRSGREALLSCGAVLDHFRVALTAAGWGSHVLRYPNPNDTHHVASIECSPLAYVTEAHRRRAQAIRLRRTDRLPFGAPPDWGVVELLLRRSIDDDGVELSLVAEADRPRLAEASHLTEALRQYDSDYHAELDWWTGPFGSSDGIPHSSLVSAAESDRVDVGRSFPVSRHHPERRLAVPEDRSKILVLSTFDDDRSAVLRCGEALSALLLEATVAGLATCTLTHLIEVDLSRDIVSSMVHTEYPQVLVRVGTRPSPDDDLPETPRRQLSDVVELRL